MKRTVLTLLTLAVLALNTFAADIITQWTFNSNPPDGTNATGTLAPAVGNGSAALVGGTTSAFTSGATLDATGGNTNNSGWNTTTYPAATVGNKTRGVEFRLSTEGFESIIITWEQRDSTSASKYTRLQYSADGINFIDGPVIVPSFTPTSSGTSFGSQSASLESIGAVDNNPNFAFRLVTEFESTATGSGAASYVAAATSTTYGTSGTIRYDLVTISGSPATGNNPPSITSIANQTTRVNESVNNLAFTVGDVETPVEELIVTPSSSNISVIPNENIILGGAGANRTVSFAPALFASGQATITLTVTDGGGKSAPSSFVVTVLPENTPPSISASFTNYYTLPGVALAPVPFTVGDLETPAGDLEVIISSSNPTVIPEANVVVETDGGANRTLTITPVAGQVGNAVITVTVGDFLLTTGRSFNVMVVPAATVVLNEPFEYPNGSTITNSAGLWSNHSGTAGQSQLAGGSLQLLSSQTEDISARLIGGPYRTGTGTVLYASFRLNYNTLPVDRGDYFAHFLESSATFRGRVFVSTTNSPAGTYRLGIGNTASTITNAVTLAQELSPGVSYLVVMRYNIDTGLSTLWLNPGSESSFSLTATDAPNPTAITYFAFRQSTGIGAPTIDDLKVGLSFVDVVPGAFETRLSVQRTGGTVQISWPAAATDDGYSLRASSSLSPSINWQPVGSAPVRNGATDSLTLPATGNRFFQLVK